MSQAPSSNPAAQEPQIGQHQFTENGDKKSSYYDRNRKSLLSHSIRYSLLGHYSKVMTQYSKPHKLLEYKKKRRKARLKREGKR